MQEKRCAGECRCKLPAFFKIITYKIMSMEDAKEMKKQMMM